MNTAGVLPALCVGIPALGPAVQVSSLASLFSDSEAPSSFPTPLHRVHQELPENDVREDFPFLNVF